MSRKKTHNKTNIILERISDHYHLNDDVAIGAFYGVNKTTVSSWRTRDKINEALVRAKCGDDKELADWFMLGIERTLTTPNSRSAVQFHSSSHSSPPPADLVDMTMEILKSGTVFDLALRSNIIAFHAGVQMKTELESTNKRVEVLEDSVKRLELLLSGRDASKTG